MFMVYARLWESAHTAGDASCYTVNTHGGACVGPCLMHVLVCVPMCWCVCPCLIHVVVRVCVCLICVLVCVSMFDNVLVCVSMFDPCVSVCVSVFYTCVGMCDRSAVAHSGRAPSTGNPAHIAGDVTHVLVCVSMFGTCVAVCVHV